MQLDTQLQPLLVRIRCAAIGSDTNGHSRSGMGERSGIKDQGNTHSQIMTHTHIRMACQAVLNDQCNNTTKAG